MQGVWDSLNQSIFVNCWRYTRFTSENVDEIPAAFEAIAEVDAEFVQKYQQFVQ